VVETIQSQDLDDEEAQNFVRNIGSAKKGKGKGKKKKAPMSTAKKV